jgi:hypothetical protein
MENVSLAVFYVFFNMASSLGIVFSNKAVFAVFHFPFPFLLTIIHIVFTAFGMQIMAMVRSRPCTVHGHGAPCCGPAASYACTCCTVACN